MIQAMGVGRQLLGESKLAVAVVLLIAARCVERVLYTYVLRVCLYVSLSCTARSWCKGN